MSQRCYIASCPLLSPFPPAFSLSQQQGLFQCVSSLHQVIKVLEHQSFSISPSSEYSGLISLQFKGLSRVFSSTTVRKHQFFGAQPSWVPAKPRPKEPHPSNVRTGLGQQRMGVGARGFQEEDSQPRRTSSCVWVGEGSGEKQIKGQKGEKNRSLRKCSER